MNIADILTVDRVVLATTATSKKRALEILSERIAGATPTLTPSEVFDTLFGRERLGSTGLGQGVALPHGRMPDTPRAIAAALKLDTGIEFDAPDQQPVDIMVALVVPEDSAKEHLELLAQLAETFSNAQTLGQLRATGDPQALLELLTRETAHHAA